MKDIVFPKMPYGQGGFSWVNKEKGIIRYRLTYKAKADGKSYRLFVDSTSVTNCFRLMEEKKHQTEEKARKNYAVSIENQSVKLADAMLAWLAETKLGKNKANSYDRDECTIVNQIQPYDIGQLQVVDVCRDDVIAHIDYLQFRYNDGKGYSFSVVKKTFEILDQFFSYFYRNDPSRNPMNGLARPLPKRVINEITIEEAAEHTALEDLVLSDEEINVFRDFCMREPKNGCLGGTKYGKHLYFMLLTFLRVGEATTLVWSDVDFEKKELTVSKAVSRVKNREQNASFKTKIILTKPKTKSGIRKVALTDEAIDVLLSIKNDSSFTEDGDFIFSTNKGSRVLEQNLLSGLKGILKASGINKNGNKDAFDLHYLRHTGISYYLRHGTPIDAIAQMAGHSSSAVTANVYYHIIRAQRETAASVMNSIVRGT